MEEEWKTLEGFSNYLFSNKARVKRISDGRIEKLTKCGKPQYWYVHLYPDGEKRKNFRLHRLIAQAWIPNPNNYKVVDHINRNKLDNRIENLRWTCHSGNQKNTEGAYFAIYKGFWVHVKTFYKDDLSAYGYAYQNKHLSNDLEELERMRNTSNHTKTVIWEGEEKLLKDLCDEYSKDYETVLSRLHTSNTTVYGCVFYDKIPYVSFEMKGVGGVSYQFSSQTELAEYLGTNENRIRDFFHECGGDLIKLKHLCDTWQPQDRRTEYTIEGVTKFREEWITFYETSEQRVSENMSKYSLCFEDAVQLPVLRVRRVLLNGIEITLKQMWEKYGLNPKTCNNYKSANKLTYLQTLCKFGVDTKGVTIVPL